MSLITREELLEYFRGAGWMRTEGIRRLIEKAPEVKDVRPVRSARWILRNEQSMYPIFCSECKAWQTGRSKYCPDCGAEMTNPNAFDDEGEEGQ